MKYYDKDIYKQEKRFEMIVIIICVFIIGFLTGYACIDYAINNTNNEMNIVEGADIDERIQIHDME